MVGEAMQARAAGRFARHLAAARENEQLMRHAIHFGIFAIAMDALYTTVYWLILGRDKRRNSKHAEVKYFLILGQLAAELAAIVHLAGLRKKVQG